MENTIKEASIDANRVYYRELNEQIKAVADSAQKITVQNVCGQRYIGTNLNKKVELVLNGVPGNDLGAFMNGPTITVNGNVQDGCGNTMNEGEITVYGHAGDVLGLSARGGRIFIRDTAGYRAGIHMKEYLEKKPTLVIGGSTQDFLGEYMAGGVILLLGLNLGDNLHHTARFIGTGMHGGAIFVRGTVDEYQLGSEVNISMPSEQEMALIESLSNDYAAKYKVTVKEILSSPFIKIAPKSVRPYKKIYVY